MTSRLQYRQANWYQCYGDITPLVWARSIEHDRVKEVMEVSHQCRNFDSIYAWADTHQMVIGFDFTAGVVDNDPLGWTLLLGS